MSVRGHAVRGRHREQGRGQTGQPGSGEAAVRREREGTAGIITKRHEVASRSSTWCGRKGSRTMLEGE